MDGNIDVEMKKITEKELQEQKPQKTAEEVLRNYTTYLDRFGIKNIQVRYVLEAMEEYASQFQQPITNEMIEEELGRYIDKCPQYLSKRTQYQMRFAIKYFIKWALSLKAQQPGITDEEIEKWAEKWELNDKVFEDTIMPFIFEYKTGLIHGAKAMRDNEIKDNKQKE